jgi:hypothetical protein
MSQYDPHALTMLIPQIGDRLLVPLVQPTVNLNGTDKIDLMNQVLDIKLALEKVNDVMAAATPHGRDYQLAPAGTDAEARNAWNQRRLILNAMTSEMYALAILIHDQ